MARLVADAVLDAALNYIKNNGVTMTACSTQPTTYAEATSTYKLADVTIDSADYTGPADHTSGRKLTVNAQTGITVDSSGTYGHVAICSSDTLLYVTTGTSQVLTAGNTVDFPAWVISIADPTAPA